MSQIPVAVRDALIARAALELQQGILNPPDLLVKFYAIMLNMDAQRSADSAAPSLQDAMDSGVEAEKPRTTMEKYLRWVHLFFTIEELEEQLAESDLETPSAYCLEEALENEVHQVRNLMAGIGVHNLPRPLALGIARQVALGRCDFNTAFQFLKAEDAAREHLNTMGAATNP